MLNDKDAWRLQYHLMPPDGWLNDSLIIITQKFHL